MWHARAATAVAGLGRGERRWLRVPRGLEEKQGGGTGRQATQHASKQPHMSGAPGPPAPPGMTQFHGGYANAYQMPGTAFYGAQGLTGGASRRRQDVSAERRLKTLTIPEDEEVRALGSNHLTHIHAHLPSNQRELGVRVALAKL